MRRIVAALALLGSFASPGVAHANVQACLAASEKGQHARAAGKLREARDQFQICGGERCPAIVRRDCVQWESEVVAILPTVVFGARDESGRDLFDVTVSMDGEVMTTKLDGKSIRIDPGPHTFTFEAGGLPQVTERALVKEGEKARVINVTFHSGHPSDTADKDKDKDKTGTSSASAGGDKGLNEGHTPWPWVLVGVGGAAIVAGVVVYAVAPSRPANCDKTTQTCSRLPDESDAQLQQDQQRAGKADTQPTVGLVVGGLGVGAVVAGLVWHFAEASAPANAPAPSGGGGDGSIRVSPWIDARSSGLSVVGRF